MPYTSLKCTRSQTCACLSNVALKKWHICLQISQKRVNQLEKKAFIHESFRCWQMLLRIRHQSLAGLPHITPGSFLSVLSLQLNVCWLKNVLWKWSRLKGVGSDFGVVKVHLHPCADDMFRACRLWTAKTWREPCHQICNMHCKIPQVGHKTHCVLGLTP